VCEILNKQVKVSDLWLNASACPLIVRFTGGSNLRKSEIELGTKMDRDRPIISSGELDVVRVVPVQGIVQQFLVGIQVFGNNLLHNLACQRTVSCFRVQTWKSILK
jgi:hypothetical protein